MSLLQCQERLRDSQTLFAPDKSPYHLLSQRLILIPLRSPSEQIQIVAFTLMGPETEGYLYATVALASLGLGIRVLSVHRQPKTQMKRDLTVSGFVLALLAAYTDQPVF